MVMDMEVELSDIYTGTTYSIQVTRKQICEHCEGSGARSASDIHECDACSGRGVRIVKHMLAPGMYQQVQMHCDKCGGRGKTIKHTCPHCSGARIVSVTSDIGVDIDRGLSEGQELVFEGEADESPDYVAGDLVVRVRSKKQQGGFVRRGENLYWKQSIGVHEALLGFERSIEHLDGHVIKLVNPEGRTVQPGYVQVLHGEGLPKYHSSECKSLSHLTHSRDEAYTFSTTDGDLFIEYQVVLPESISSSTEKRTRILTVSL